MSIEGLSNVSSQEVKLYSVDRSENISDPVTVTIEPLTPPYLSIYGTVKVYPDFGGAKFVWENENRTPIFINLLAEDTTSTLKSHEIHYTSQEVGERALRGFDPKPIRFAAIIGDRYDNYSDTVIETITPLFEEEFDKSLYRNVPLPNDHDWGAWEGEYEHLFDDDPGTIAHTYGGSGWPQSLTLDFGGIKKISRMKLFQRYTSLHFAYTHGNPKRWEVYGRSDKPESDGSWDNWTLLRECTMIKPSGLPIGQTTNEDMDAMYDGHEFAFDVSTTPNVRYIRIIVTETWDGSTYCNLSGLSFFGQSEDSN